ncbi:MAG: hypothetical protein V2J55_16205 [Candidatus Competibacteraceae bacterium]|nr:hypothetical protein [Candidatus Competibacteraceae bacterium]
MFSVHSDQQHQRYSPLYFLAALGAGGLTVSFFMWLMFWVPHPGRPVPVFEDLITVFVANTPLLSLSVIVAMTGIAFFAFLMTRLLFWNFRSLDQWKQTSAYQLLKNSNNETQLLAVPLTVAMALNVGFIIGLVFIPKLWSIIEYLFPLALIGFLATGFWALRLMGDFWGRILIQGGFDCSSNNSFSQLLPAFALSMVGVGLAAPAAMSHTTWVAGVSYVVSSFFIVSALLLTVIKLIIGLRAMMENGASEESAPSLWIVIPILTVTSITLIRQEHGIHVHFEGHALAVDTFTMLTRFFVMQVAFALFGWMVLHRFRYFSRFVSGPEHSAGSFTLVCPGVALVVMTQFLINKGFVAVNLVEKFGMVYWVLTAFALLLQAATIGLVLILNAKHFGKSPNTSFAPNQSL